MSGLTVDLITGIRDLLLADGITPVQIGPLVDTPDQCVGVAPYPLVDDLINGDSLVGVQITVRGSKTGGSQPVYALQERILLLVGGLRQMAFTSDANVVLAWRQISAPLALDAQGRPAIRDSYYVRSNRLER